MQRLRSISPTFEDHIAADTARLKARLPYLRDGPEKDELLEKIRQLETVREWLSSRELQPPRIEPELKIIR